VSGDCYVCMWPLADVAVVSANVRFQEKNGRGAGRGSTSANDPKRGVRSSWNSVRASRAASRGSGPGEDRDCTIELRITTTHGVRVSLDLDRGCDANAFQPLAVDMHVRDREQ
jgi:hypothetical protein